MLLHHILGADVGVFPVSFKDLNEKIFVEIAEEMRMKGYTPYIAGFAGSTPIGVLGYVNAMTELLNQANSQGMKINYVLTACGTGGTQAGLILGAKALNVNIKVVGVAISSDYDIEVITPLVKKTAKLLGANSDFKSEEITVFNEYIGEGYGAIYKGVVDAIKLVAQKEGLFLDPVYTGKAMAGLIDLIEEGYFTKKDTVVFLHTGGTPGLFAYRAPMKFTIESGMSPWKKPPWGLW